MALRQGLRVGVHFLRAVQTFAAAQKLVVDAQHHFAAGFERRGHQQIEGAADRAFGGVFHGDDGVVGLIRFHAAHAFVHAGAGGGVGGMAEMLDRRLLGKRAFRAEVGDGERPLHGQAFAHHFAKQPCHALVRQGAFVHFLNPPQHLRLALGAVHHACAFELADGAGVDGAFV